MSHCVNKPLSHRYLRGRWSASFAVLLLLGGAGTATAKWEQQQMALERDMQDRIEGILAKTLPPNSYLVTVKAEMEEKANPASVQTRSSQRNNPFLNENRFILPGVPQKKEFGGTDNSETIINSGSAESLV